MPERYAEPVTGQVKFDSGKRRYSAAETEALKAGIQELNKIDLPMITFEHTGAALLESGRVREALTEYRSLARLHPKEALHHNQIARALLSAGIGDAARSEAQKAIALEPASSKVHSAYGWILQHDLVGRRFEKGFDYAGAVAAYRKAVELEPDNHETRADLAILLEHNERGTRYGPRSQLKEAIAEYRKIQDHLESVGIPQNLPVALMWAGQFKEMRETVGKLKPSSHKNSLELIAISATDGPAAALREVVRLGSSEDARRDLLVGAGQALIKIRKYSEAAELITAGARGRSNAAALLNQAGIFRQLKKHEEDLLPATDPRAVIQRLFQLTFSPEFDVEAMLALFTKEAAERAKPEEFETVRPLLRQARSAFTRAGFTDEVAIDVILGSVQLTSEGDDEIGYRVRIGGTTAPQIFYVMREEGRYKAYDSGGDLNEVGMEILKRIARNDLMTARRLLDWAREDLVAAGGDDPLAGAAFPRFWERGGQPDATVMRYAAAALAARETGTVPHAIPILREGRERAAADSKWKFDLALAEGFTKLKKYEELLPVAQELLKIEARSTAAFNYLLTALRQQGRFAESEKAAQARLTLLPDDAIAIRALAEDAAVQLKNDQAAAHWKKLIASGKATPGDMNGLAWQALFGEKVTDEALEVAGRANVQTQNQNFPILHTLAALQVELGKTTEAREMMLQGMNVAGLEEPNEASWYVFGRIAEQYGEAEAATAAYKRLKEPETPGGKTISSYALAQKRLAFLAKR